MSDVKADMMGRLVDEGARILAADGPAALSLRKVATAAGVSTMPVYTLFGDKRGLLAAMHREAFRRLRAALEAVPAGDDPLAYLAMLGLAYRQSALDGPHLYGLMFGHLTPDISKDAEGLAAAEAAYRPLVAAVERAQAAGILAGGDPEHIALHLWAVAHGMVSLELNGQLPPIGPAEELYAAALMNAVYPFLVAG
jgi:AcrR family transcriptional regulator